MSGVSLQYNLSDIKKLQKKIARLGKLDTSDLMSSIGVEIESQTRRRLEEEKTAPDGSAWEELSEPYKSRKANKSSGGTLEFDGDLIDSITSEASSDHVEIGSNLIYAAVQNFGGEEVGMDIPSRKYLGLSDENIDDIAAIVNNFVDDHVKEAFAA